MKRRSMTYFTYLKKDGITIRADQSSVDHFLSQGWEAGTFEEFDSQLMRPYLAEIEGLKAKLAEVAVSVGDEKTAVADAEGTETVPAADEKEQA